VQQPGSGAAVCTAVRAVRESGKGDRQGVVPLLANQVVGIAYPGDIVCPLGISVVLVCARAIVYEVSDRPIFHKVL